MSPDPKETTPVTTPDDPAASVLDAVQRLDCRPAVGGIVVDASPFNPAPNSPTKWCWNPTARNGITPRPVCPARSVKS